MFSTTVGYSQFFCCSLEFNEYITLAAREDAISVKTLIHSSNSGRTREFDDGEPTPTQRAAGSLETVSKKSDLQVIHHL